MSIFSKIKGAKKAAEDHKKKAEVTSTIPEQPKAPYKHVPTHAATDSLNVGGASRDTDMRERIREQHKRRSAMPPSSQSSSRSSSRSSLRSGTELSPDQRARTFARSSSDLSIASVMQRQPVYQQSTRQRAYFSHGSIHGSSSSMCLRPSPLSATPSLTATEGKAQACRSLDVANPAITESLEEDEEESPVVSSQTSTKSSSSSRMHTSIVYMHPY